MARFKTYYMDEAVFDLSTVIKKAKKALAGVDYDTIVGTGFSGGIVVPALALSLDKNFVLIRKEDDDSHHGKGLPVGELGARWVFVDDFISSGRTRSRVIRKINESLIGLPDSPTTMVGQYLYLDRSDSGPTFKPYDASWVLKEGKRT